MEFTTLTDRYAVAAQISVTDVKALTAAGFSTVICNRPDGEDPGQPSAADIAAACEAAGIEFHHIPVVSAPIDANDVAQQQRVVEAAKGLTLAYCRSGQRSAVIFQMGLA